MKPRVVSLLLACVFVSVPVFAQGKGGPTADLAALTARVSKLEGNIVASDLAGTYELTGFSTDMRGFRPGPPPEPATISTSVLRLKLTLNANGSASLSPSDLIPGIACEGATLTLTGAMHAADCDDTGPINDVTWAYANGVVTITFLNGADDDEALPFSVALGGRFLILAFSPFHASDPSSDHALFIASRLN